MTSIDELHNGVRNVSLKKVSTQIYTPKIYYITHGFRLSSRGCGFVDNHVFLVNRIQYNGAVE